jgi:copper oxidase (laccase) domain-containing protein
MKSSFTVLIILQVIHLSTSTCPSKLLFSQNVDINPNVYINLVGVEGTNYTFSRSIDPVGFNFSIQKLKDQKDQFQNQYKDIFIPTSLLNGNIKLINDANSFINEIFADVLITTQCMAIGIIFSDAMPFVITDGNYICVGVIGTTNCKIASRIVDSIKTNFTNDVLNNSQVYLGPSSRSPYYYVGENVYNQYTEVEKGKYFVKILTNDTDVNGNFIMHKRDQLDGKPRYGFDFSVYFKDKLIEQGIPKGNIYHDETNSMLSDTLTSVRAETVRVYNLDPYSNKTSAQINQSVGRNSMFVLF